MRFRLLLIIGGIMLTYSGWQEMTLSRHAKDEPVEISTVDLESGKIPENCHVVVKDAVALYPSSVYHYKKSKYSTKAPDESTRITDALYPVISKKHPFFQALMTGKTSDKQLEEALSSFGVIVKTTSFGTVGGIPQQMKDGVQLQGLILNHIEKLDSKDEQLLRNSFPKLDPTKVVILEEARKPKGMLISIGMMVGGVILAILALVVGTKKS
jgi:hypothetical protein